jgi:hypothetical protein
MCHVSDCEFIGPLPALGVVQTSLYCCVQVGCGVFIELLPSNALSKSVNNILTLGQGKGKSVL